MRRDTSAPKVSVFVFEESWRSWDRDNLDRVCSTLAACDVTRFITETWSLDHGLIDAVHRHGMEFWASVSCFSDHAHPVRDHRPELTPITSGGTPRQQQEWYVGLIPTDDQYNLELLQRCVRIVSDFDVDGLGLDFMRWPLHWELELRPGAAPIDSSFDPITLREYRRFDPTTPAHLTGKKAAEHILGSRLDNWTAFKCQTITSLVAGIRQAVQVRRPQVATGLFLVPGDEDERRRYVGQDAGALGAAVDEIFVMAYHRIVERDVAWIEDTLSEVRAATSEARVTPVVQVTSDPAFAGDADWGAPIGVQDARAALAASRTASSHGGFVVFPGEALLVGPDAGQLRQTVRAIATNPARSDASTDDADSRL